MTRMVTQLDDEVLEGRSTTPEAGFGVLETERGGLPLLALDVRARLSGLVADITVRQTFRNSLDVPLEATYIFPLPDRAAVTSFQMKVADRVVEGVLKERGEAREAYEKAIRKGHRAAIAEEERSGTFSLRVGNIPPKETVSVELSLVGMVPFFADEAEFRFPLVVAPRYVPGVPLDGLSVGLGWGADTDQVPDASRVTPPVLLPGFPNPVRLSLEVEVDPAGLDASQADWISRVRSSLHSVIVESGPPWKVRLQPGERLNRDFILRYPLAGATAQTSLLVSPDADGKGGTFALTVVPPARDRLPPPEPRDVVFVLDRSGSMGGWKIVAARRAVGWMIDTLLEHDRFTVLAFDDWAEFPPQADGKLVEASNRNRSQVLRWLERIDARGGTEVGRAMRTAAGLLGKRGADRQRVVVLVTDGQVAGEDQVLRSLAKVAGGAPLRIHTVGIDQAVNAGFLRRLADYGKGICELVESESQLDAAMGRIHRAIGQPVLTGLRLEAMGASWEADTLVPSSLPDVFADRPVTIFGRLPGGVSLLRLGVHGVEATGQGWQQEVIARPACTEALKSLWGRAKVRELEDLYASGLEEDLGGLAQEIVEVSLSTRVLSRFTAYVAIDRSEVVSGGGKPVEIIQPVEPPEGWEMTPWPQSMPFVACAPPRDFHARLSDAAWCQHLVRYRSRGFPSDLRRDAAEQCAAVARKLCSAAPRSRGKLLKRLLQKLEELLALYAGTQGPEAEAIGKAVEQVRSLLEAADRGDNSVLADAKVRELAEAIEQLNAKIQEQVQASEESEREEMMKRLQEFRRRKFWK